jgi:PadR family transcriptional regulator PadR
MFTHGLLEVYILSVAKSRPISGKNVANSIEKITQGAWKPSPGSIYPALAKLEKAGLIKAKLGENSGGRGRREIKYVLTAKGEKAFPEIREKCAEMISNEGKTFLPLVIEVLSADADEEMKDILLEFHRAGMGIRDRVFTMPVNQRQEERKKIIKNMLNVFKESFEEAEQKK